MAYTIPTSVDTQEQAILAVASAVKGEQVTGGDGSVNKALDILADALAGENVEVPMTQQGAILALAQYVGGGGGVDVGPLTRVSEEAAAQPAVGNWGEFGTVIATIKIGSATITDNGEMAEVPNAAAGTTVSTDITMAEDADTADAYVCTLEGNWTNGWQYKAVTPWDGTITREEVEYEGKPAYRWTFTVPELQEGQWLIIWRHIAA